MAQFMVLNPRRRRRRRRSVARVARPRRRRRRRANPGMYLLNRRRRRTVRHRAHNPRRRRRHRNPFGVRMPSRGTFFGIDFGAGLLVAGGTLASGIGATTISNLVPVDFVKQPIGRLLLKLALTPVVGQVGSMAFGREGGKLIALGSTAGVALDAYKMLQTAMPSLPSLGDYNEVLNDYVAARGNLSDYQSTPGLAAITQPNPRPVFIPNWHGTG